MDDAQLERNLKEFGDTFNWISLCEEWSELTENDLELHRQIKETDINLWSLQQIIANMVKENQKPFQPLAKTKGKPNKSREVWRTTRESVQNCN